MQAGASEQKVRDLPRFRESSHFGPRERLALAYAEEMTRASARVTDEVFARLREHFAEAAIVELTAIVALENFRSKFNSALQVPAQGFCPIPVTPDD